jgi:hypothetical protein
MAPISRASAVMRNRRNEHMIRFDVIPDCVREAIQDKATLASSVLRPSQRRFRDASESMVDLENERLRSNLTASLVPVPSFVKFSLCVAMKPNLLHSPRNSRARISSQGTVSTAPDWISSQRRSDSAAHSSSTSGSGGGSKLSMRSPASVARSLSESSKTSRNCSRRSRDIGGILPSLGNRDLGVI